MKTRMKATEGRYREGKCRARHALHGWAVTVMGSLLAAGCAPSASSPAPTTPTTTPTRPAAAAPASPKARAGSTPRPQPATSALAPFVGVDLPNAACAQRDRELAEAYAPYPDAFVNRGLELSPDGKHLLFLSNRDGGSLQLQLGAVKAPAKEPEGVAVEADAVGDARFTPDGKHLLFIRDRRRDENYGLYRASGDGSQVGTIATNRARFHHLPLVSPDSQTVYYFTGEQRTGRFDLVSQPVAGGIERRLFRGQGFHFLTDLSPDGKRLLVTKLKSLSESALLLIEVDSGKVTQVAPSPGVKAHARHGVFSADGKSIYLVTDAGTPRLGLRKVDAATFAQQASFVDPLGEVADVEVARKGDGLAVVLHAGSHQTLRLLDPATLAPRRPVKVPLGTVDLGRFTADGKGLVVNLSTPSAPGDVFLLEVRSGRLRPLRRDVRPGLKALPKVKATVERVASFDKTSVPMNVYLPPRLPAGRKLPVVVLVHGGPASASSIRWNPWVAFLVGQGLAVVEPNVRGSTGFGKAYEQADNGRKRMDAVKDLAAVNAWVREQPWADAERLVVAGGSYGGYMTYMALGHQPALWRAGVGLVGVVNLRTFLATTTGAIRLAFREEFGELPQDGAFLDAVSPIQATARVKAPLFVYQGQNDPRVPRSEQDQLVRALRTRAVPVEYMVAADEGHSLDQRANKLEFVARSLRFLEQHLGLPEAPSGCKTLLEQPAHAKELREALKRALRRPAKPKTVP
ncbi:MAG: S9 family peptidase [Deltaproteobacteria bacterium]|nr:S9 family peptidase [Deltaproteobacteria bacterium]